MYKSDAEIDFLNIENEFSVLIFLSAYTFSEKKTVMCQSRLKKYLLCLKNWQFVVVRL